MRRIYLMLMLSSVYRYGHHLIESRALFCGRCAHQNDYIKMLTVKIWERSDALVYTSHIPTTNDRNYSEWRTAWVRMEIVGSNGSWPSTVILVGLNFRQQQQRWQHMLRSEWMRAVKQWSNFGWWTFDINIRSRSNFLIMTLTVAVRGTSAFQTHVIHSRIARCWRLWRRRRRQTQTMPNYKMID